MVSGFWWLNHWIVQCRKWRFVEHRIFTLWPAVKWSSIALYPVWSIRLRSFFGTIISNALLDPLLKRTSFKIMKITSLQQQQVCYFTSFSQSTVLNHFSSKCKNAKFPIFLLCVYFFIARLLILVHPEILKKFYYIISYSSATCIFFNCDYDGHTSIKLPFFSCEIDTFSTNAPMNHIGMLCLYIIIMVVITNHTLCQITIEYYIFSNQFDID